jgi:hypothetical protein
MATHVPITISDEIARPTDIPRHGERRLVRLLPTPFGSRPAIWTSPYVVWTSLQEGAPTEPCRVCVLLMSTGTPNTPRPDTLCVTIPTAAVEKFPLVPIEW